MAVVDLRSARQHHHNGERECKCNLCVMEMCPTADRGGQESKKVSDGLFKDRSAPGWKKCIKEKDNQEM